jgi:hypothetical protein
MVAPLINGTVCFLVLMILGLVVVGIGSCAKWFPRRDTG